MALCPCFFQCGMVTVGGAGSVFGPGGLILLQHREHRHCFFSDMSDGFDRAPGAGRSRGRGVLGSGLGRGRSRGQEAVESGKIPGFRAQSGGEANSAPHKAGGRQQQGPLRPPRTSPSVISETAADQSSQRTSPSLVQIPVQNNSMAGSKSQSAESTPVSSLSVDAAEFYPPGYVIDHSNVDQNGDYPGVPQESFAEFVQQFLNYLTEQPGSFEVEIYNFLEVLNNSVTTDCLQELVELVYQQSTSVPNFSYTGARICNFLSINLHINSQSGNFRQILLQRCHTEYEKRDQGAKGDQATRKRFHAFVLFLGELYLKLEVKGSNGQLTKAEVLQSGLRELLSALFSNPVDDNLICAVKLLKLTGSILEDAWKEKGESFMDGVIQRMENVVLDAECSRDVKQMLLKLVELRSSNWGRVYAASTFRDATPETDPNYFMNEPTFYTSEGVPFTAADPDYQEKYQELLDRDVFPDYEENGTDLSSGDMNFDDFDDDDDQMDPEMEEAYEKFCLESESLKKQ